MDDIKLKREKLLKDIYNLLDKYESEHPSNNDVSCEVSFFDGTIYVYDGEGMVEV